jgi:membrane-bound metal-dependent hydrolase YbcI (DUF457 family)
MASPVGHAMAGVTCAAAVSAVAGAPDGVVFWAGAIVAAGAPDLDFVPYVLGLGSSRCHRGPSHSLLTLGATIVAVLLVSSTEIVPVDGRHLAAWSAALVSHPLLDLLTTGPRIAADGSGIALFWPLSNRRQHLRRPLFEQDGRWLSCRSPRCMLRLLTPELLWLGPLCAIVSVISLLR